MQIDGTLVTLAVTSSGVLGSLVTVLVQKRKVKADAGETIVDSVTKLVTMKDDQIADLAKRVGKLETRVEYLVRRNVILEREVVRLGGNPETLPVMEHPFD